MWVEFDSRFLLPSFELRTGAAVKNRFQLVNCSDERLWSMIIEFFILGTKHVYPVLVSKVSATEDMQESLGVSL